MTTQFSATFCIGGFCLEFSALKTAGVETPTLGLTNTNPQFGAVDSCVTSSPAPCIRVKPLFMQTGISAPKAINSSTFGNGTDQYWLSALITAAASLEPPPIPDAIGRFFSSMI